MPEQFIGMMPGTYPVGHQKRKKTGQCAVCITVSLTKRTNYIWDTSNNWNNP